MLPENLLYRVGEAVIEKDGASKTDIAFSGFGSADRSNSSPLKGAMWRF